MTTQTIAKQLAETDAIYAKMSARIEALDAVAAVVEAVHAAVLADPDRPYKQHECGNYSREYCADERPGLQEPMVVQWGCKPFIAIMLHDVTAFDAAAPLLAAFAARGYQVSRIEDFVALRRRAFFLGAEGQVAVFTFLTNDTEKLVCRPVGTGRFEEVMRFDCDQTAEQINVALAGGAA